VTERSIRHLPVIDSTRLDSTRLDSTRLVSMISIGDLIKNIISVQQFVIEQLEHYVSGERV
jgi:hypothetical protein